MPNPPNTPNKDGRSSYCVVGGNIWTPTTAKVQSYCGAEPGWKTSYTTLDGWNPMNNRLNMYKPSINWCRISQPSRFFMGTVPEGLGCLAPQKAKVPKPLRDPRARSASLAVWGLEDDDVWIFLGMFFHEKCRHYRCFLLLSGSNMWVVNRENGRSLEIRSTKKKLGFDHQNEELTSRDGNLRCDGWDIYQQTYGILAAKQWDIERHKPSTSIFAVPTEFDQLAAASHTKQVWVVSRLGLSLLRKKKLKCTVSCICCKGW